MSDSSKSYNIAKELVNFYSQIDKNEITPEQQTIINELETCSYNDDGRRNGKIDYFFKRINNINTTFMLSENIIDKNPDIIMPRPVFDIFKYDNSSLIGFLKVLIENSMKDNKRKDKHNFYKKIDVDKDNSDIINIISKISDKEYNSFEYIKSNYDINNLEKLWSEIFCEVINKYRDKKLSYDKKCELENICNKRKKLKAYVIMYTRTWNDCFKKIIKDFQDGNDGKYIQLKGHNAMLPVIRYKIIWNLWIRIANRVFQQICVNYGIKEEGINDLINELSLLIKNIENSPDTGKYEESIADGYYKYYYMLEVSSILNMELIGLNFINKKEFIFLRKEDLFADEANKIKEEFADIDKIEIGKLNKLFNSGQDCTKNETFKKNIEYCKKFIPIYNCIAHRNISENDIRNLRGIYRALFVNTFTYKRINTYSMSKKIIDLYEKEVKAYNIANDYSPDDIETIYKNILNDIHEEDSNLNKHHFILGNSISNSIFLEQVHGYDTLKFKYKFMEAFYKLSLLIFYRDCPGMNAGHEDVRNALNNIEGFFDQVMAALMNVINCSNPEEEA